MPEYQMIVQWERGEQPFIDNRYSRGHSWIFDGGVSVPASSSPHTVRVPFSLENAVDPEEAFVASLSSCHMLWFLSIAAKKGFCVDRYIDHATGVLEKNAEQRLAMTKVTLHPRVVFSGSPAPTREEIQAMHEQAHEECFIATSVKTEVRCEPVFEL